jgi:hypothetical protein
MDACCSLQQATTQQLLLHQLQPRIQHRWQHCVCWCCIRFGGTFRSSSSSSSLCGCGSGNS